MLLFVGFKCDLWFAFQWFFFFFFFQLMLVLKEPITCPLLAHVYRGQQQRLQVILDEIMEIQQLTDTDVSIVSCLWWPLVYLSQQEQNHCDGPVTSCFHGDTVTSTLHVSIPDDLVELMEFFTTGNMIKIKCRMGYSYTDRCFRLTVQDMEKISSVEVVVK